VRSQPTIDGDSCAAIQSSIDAISTYLPTLGRSQRKVTSDICDGYDEIDNCPSIIVPFCDSA